MIRNATPTAAAVFGVDIGKNVFHVVGLDDRAQSIQKAKFRRDTLLQFFERAAPTLVGMEACPGSQWLARKLRAMGHKVRIIPAQFVKPYVKSQQERHHRRGGDRRSGDTADDALRRKSGLQNRSTCRRFTASAIRLVTSRTRLINQMRAFCLEYGIAIRQGAGVFKPRPAAGAGRRDATTSRRRCGAC